MCTWKKQIKKDPTEVVESKAQSGAALKVSGSEGGTCGSSGSTMSLHRKPVN